ncbi:MAG: sulfatase [Bryobacterales bacterium]|jgi:arylsulfatase A-like enzyme|nr:sulfatase [Bryobacterales bacterium]
MRDQSAYSCSAATRRDFLHTSAIAGSAALGFPAILRGQRGPKPNIVWILAEDFSPDLGCYGNKIVTTPRLDQMAAEGVRFHHAFTTAPVCSASRSAFATGMFQTTIGAHNHRSHRDDGYQLPQGVDTIARHLRRVGYHTVNLRGEFAPGARGAGKDDFNFNVAQPWDSNSLQDRPQDKPLYLQVNFSATHKGPAYVQARKEMQRIPPESLPLPPYWPDHPVVRNEYANHLECANLLDRQVGQLFGYLRAEKLLDNTAVFFMGDHGQCLIRGKQWLYDAGLRVPLIAWYPKVWNAGQVRNDLVYSIDMTATTARLGGAVPERPFQGQDLFDAAPPRDILFAARDRCDMTVDRIRSARDQRFKLIRNFMPERPYTQYNEYIERQYPTLGVMKDLYAQGKLNAVQSLFMQPRKPDWELYDTRADPFEVNNLANDPAHRATRDRLAARLEQWIEDSGDMGRVPETGYTYR